MKQNVFVKLIKSVVDFTVIHSYTPFAYVMRINRQMAYNG